MTNFFVPKARRRAGRVVDLKVPNVPNRMQTLKDLSSLFRLSVWLNKGRLHPKIADFDLGDKG